MTNPYNNKPPSRPVNPYLKTSKSASASLSSSSGVKVSAQNSIKNTKDVDSAKRKNQQQQVRSVASSAAATARKPPPPPPSLSSNANTISVKGGISSTNFISTTSHAKKPQAAVAAVVTKKPPLSLKAKLKQDIEQLRRSQAQKKQLLLEEKKRKQEEKLQRKLQEAKRKKLQADQEARQAEFEKKRQDAEQEAEKKRQATNKENQLLTSSASLYQPPFTNPSTTGSMDMDTTTNNASSLGTLNNVTPTLSSKKETAVTSATATSSTTGSSSSSSSSLPAAGAGAASATPNVVPPQQQQQQLQSHELNAAPSSDMAHASHYNHNHHHLQQHQQPYHYPMMPSYHTSWQHQQQQPYYPTGFPIAPISWMMQHHHHHHHHHQAGHPSGLLGAAVTGHQQPWVPSSAAATMYNQQPYLYQNNAMLLPQQQQQLAPPHFLGPSQAHSHPVYHQPLPCQSQPRRHSLEPRSVVAANSPSSSHSIARFERPNPFCETHHALSNTQIVLVKPVGGSFGVTLKLETLSALVEPEWMMMLLQQAEQEKQEKETMTTTIPTTTQTTTAVVEASGNNSKDINKDSNEASEPAAMKEPEQSETSTTVKAQLDAAAAAAATAATAATAAAAAAAAATAAATATATATTSKPETVIAKSTLMKSSEEDPMSKTETSGVDAKNSEEQAGVPNASEANKKQPRRQRRRRHYFSALVVQDSSVQNSRHSASSGSASSSVNLLQPGDILLQINGQETADLTFQEALTLIKDCVQPDECDGMVRCVVLVARRKPMTAQVKKTPFPSTQSQLTTRSGPFTGLELEAFAKCLLTSALDSRRVLGSTASSSSTHHDDDNRLQVLIGMEPTLSNNTQSLPAMKGQWKALCADIEHGMVAKALIHWKTEWEKEAPEVRLILPEHQQPMTDAQRSQLRNNPRPAKGCRCGGSNHEYVNDPKCPLYSNLRMLASGEDIENSSSSQDASKKISMFRDLKTVEKAFTDRIVRMKAEQQAEESEARFVSLMEEIQLKVFNRAIFAPESLTAMVLSAVAELRESFEREVENHKEEEEEALSKTQSLSEQAKMTVAAKADSDDSGSDSDDDIPLSALHKRAPATNKQSPSKKPKRDTSVRFKCLAMLVNRISHKWGHVYREPSDTDYAWRWEVYNCETDGSKRKANTKNPYREGTLSLENIRFGIDATSISKVECKNALATERTVALTTLAHFMSPERTGVVDELLALLQTGVLRIDDHGIPILSKDWWMNVDLLLLEDMQNHWRPKADPNGKYGMNNHVRKQLSEKWRRSNNGWALADDPDDIIYDFDEFDDWREVFEEKQQAQSDNAEGIGRFGI